MNVAVPSPPIEQLTPGLVAHFEKRFARGPRIAFDMVFPSGFSVTTLFGPSGSGKTTVLRCLAGLEQPNTGRIHWSDEVWFDAARGVHLAPQQRDIGFLFQDYVLFPHLSVAENIRFGLRRLDPASQQRRLDEMISRFELQGLQHRYPSEISGGQQQRVALARVLARRPRLLLLDEPLSALDELLREKLRRELRTVLAQFEIPVVLVTHDRLEAIALADTLAVMQDGLLCQSGRVETVISRPANPGVARLVGVETVVNGEVLEVQEGLATIRVGDAQLLAVISVVPTRSVVLCIRGEDVALLKGPLGESSPRNHLPARIESMVPEGPLVRVSLACGFPLTALITRPAAAELQLQIGDPVVAAIKAPAIHVIAR